MMLQAVIFDYDGTLAPTLDRQYSWFQFWAKKNGKALPCAGRADFQVMYNEQCQRDGGVQNVYDHLGLPCDMKDRKHPVWPAYEEFKHANPLTLYPHAKEMVEAIWQIGALGKDPKRNRRLRMGINTTNTWASIWKELDANGIMPYFDGFITEEVLRYYHGNGNGHAIHKPSTVSLALTLGLLDSEGAFTMHVGDTLNDLRSSQKVMRLNPMRPETLITVGACYGYEGRARLEQGAETEYGTVKFNHLIDTPLELVDIVKKELTQ